MSDTWLTDLPNYLNEAGDVISEPAQAKVLAEYFSSTVGSQFPIC